MGGNKTIPNQQSVQDFIATLGDPQQAADSQALVDMFAEVAGQPAVMWGSAIIGFGNTKLTYESGREAEWPVIGFSPRKGKIALYVTPDAEGLTAQFTNLGKFTTAKGCIYIKKLADVDAGELRRLVKTAYAAGWQSPQRNDGKEQVA